MPVDNYISLSELTGQIKAVLNNSFYNKTFWVLADVVDHSHYGQKNYHFFNLVEKDRDNNSFIAKVATKAWGAGSLSIESFERITGQKFKSGISVMVNVSVTYTEAFGLQLNLNDVDTNFTVGQLEQQRQNTIHRLLTECSGFIQKVGDRFITANNKLSLNLVIQNIAVVTSKNAAGYNDFTDTIENNKYGYGVKIDPYFTMVQGEGNADALYQRLLDVYNSKIDYDAVVIIRGGGSQTDFLIFDQFNMAKIVAKFPIPIISGIGHQINETIVDLMAHTSVKTPSIAAEFIISHNKQFEENLLNLQKSIIIKTQQLFNLRQRELSQVSSTLINSTRHLLQSNKDGLTQSNQIAINTSKTILFERRAALNELSGRLLSKPKIVIGNKLNDLSNLVQNLKSFNKKYITNQRGYIGHYESMCRLMSPVNILKKGFAIIYQDDKIITDGKKLKSSNTIKIRLSESEITTTVTSNKNVNGNEFNL